MAVLCEGHVILEDFPGVGKTMLAKSIARSLDCEFARVQATPDLLPSDITGVSVFNLQGNEFEFKPGPVFANIVLVDEINRASPKTQSALLECMQEVQVTVDGTTHKLARPFTVIATQNPIEYEGTFPLPEAQLDRFTMLLTLGYPDADGRVEDARRARRDRAARATRAGVDGDRDRGGHRGRRRVFVEDTLHRYVVEILNHTRTDTRLALGASPRAGIALLRVAKAHAVVRGRDYVVPADVKDVRDGRLTIASSWPPEARTAGVDAADSIREAVERPGYPYDPARTTGAVAGPRSLHRSVGIRDERCSRSPWGSRSLRPWRGGGCACSTGRCGFAAVPATSSSSKASRSRSAWR